jgi:hypothetical protein
MPDPIEDKSAALSARMKTFNRDLDSLSQRLYTGKITLGMYEEDFRTRMREYMAGCATIAKGGDPKSMTSSDWGKVGAELKKQYNWLHGFSKAIYENRDTVSLQAIQARAHLYAEAGVKGATEIQAGYFAPNTRRDPVNILPWMPRDGSTACMNRCGCVWDLAVVSSDEAQGIKTVQATWRMDPTLENCVDCIPRDGHVEIVEVPIEEDVPSTIGFGGV